MESIPDGAIRQNFQHTLSSFLLLQQIEFTFTFICSQSPQLKLQVPLLIVPLLLVHSLAAPVPTFTETITLTTGILPILLAKLLFLKGQMKFNQAK